ncbi:MAG: hypothetical protein V1929_00590 [bacterium]
MKRGVLDSPSRLLMFYAAVAVAFAGELLLPSRSLFRWDTLLYNWPILLEARAQILAGHWPFWASSFCDGTPLLANINAGVFYPLRVLCWVLPLKAGYHLFLFAHVWLTFVGMHLFLRRGVRLPLLSAMAGALIYGASGYARSMWDTHNFMALPWIPLGLVALLEVRHRAGIALPAVLVAACWSMMIVGGDLQAACMWMPVAVLLAVLLPERVRLLKTLAFGACMALLATAVQWVPTIMASAESYRAGGLDYAEAVERSFNPVRVVEFFLPHAFGNRDTWFGAPLAGHGATKLAPWTSSMHAGLLTWLAVFFALRRLKQPLVSWSLLLGTVSLLLSFGRFLPMFHLWMELPVVSSFRYPEKYLMWTSLAIATLAGIGFSPLVTLFRSARLRDTRHTILARWSMVMLGGALLATVVFLSLTEDMPGVFAWIRHASANTLLTLLLVLVASLRAWPGPQGVVVVGLLMVDLMLPWYVEHPTSRAFDPTSPPQVAQVIAASDSPQGRFLRDRSVTRVPLPWNFQMLTPSARQSVFYAESLNFNSPRIWGLRTADGFSPSESGAMREFRRTHAVPENDSVLPPGRLALFCRKASVEWLLTTPERMDALAAEGIPVSRYASWGTNGEIVLARVEGVVEARLIAAEPGRRPPHVTDVWRQQPGRIRINIAPGSAARLEVSESFSRGWTARSQLGRPLVVSPVNGAFIGVDVPAGITQVRLEYEPEGWLLGAWTSLAGLLVLAGVLLVAHPAGARQLARKPAFVAAVACLVFAVLGLAARSQWACMYDEGFHVSRGLALLERDDSRLSYFHPPLQNLACGYFADLAVGERLHLPESKAWKRADVFMYAIDVAARNADIFRDLVRASRMGTLLFSFLLCIVGVYWASKNGGPVAAWLTAAGFALNPNMLVHGNISTSDMSVTALTLAGTVFLWKAARQSPWRNLFWSMICFVFASVAKFTGLIWLLTFLIVCVPWIAYRERRLALLFISLVGVGMLGLALLVLYGPAPQEVRVPGLAWSGARVMAGRYVEGLFRQTGHVLEGHRAFFAGDIFEVGSWWHLVAAVALKTPVTWILATVLAAPFWLRHFRRSEIVFPFLPALMFGGMLIGVNHLAIGVRHTLPLLAILIPATAVGVSRLRPYAVRMLACGLLAGTSALSVAVSYPQFISYLPLWAGGSTSGHRWLVDSNYDWGQELELLESNWAAITDANGGAPPNLVYYGFVDPRLIYRMNVGRNSYSGFMEARAIQEGGIDIKAKWLSERFNAFPGTTVASISALELHPYAIDFSKIRQGRDMGRIGNSYFVFSSQ